MNIQQIETATRIAWPAIEEVELDGGVLRFAAGVSRRSNALIPSANGQFCPRKLISATEAFYKSKGQAAVVKVLTREKAHMGFGNLDSLLARDKYQKESPTAVLGLSLDQSFTATKPLLACHLEQTSKIDWVNAWHKLRGFNSKHNEVHHQLLERIAGDVYCVVLKDQLAQSCATGMAVLNQGSLGIFGMATASEYQGLGLATKVLSSLLNWGKDHGADFAYLQVEKSNAPALALYRKLGFQQLYSYWYRVKELETDEFGSN